MNIIQHETGTPERLPGPHEPTPRVHTPDIRTPEIKAARLATTLQAASDGVIVTDLQGRIEFFNAAAEHLIGIESVAADGRDLHELLRLEESDGRPISGNLVELAIV